MNKLLENEKNNSAFRIPHSAFLKIALRNLARHKVKTVLTSAAIAISVAVYILVSSWIGGMSAESRLNIVNYDMSAAKLQSKLYFEMKDEKPSYENFKNWEKYAAALDSAGYSTAPRFVFLGEILSNSGSAPMMINAVEPSAEAKVLRYMEYVDFGRMPENGEFEIAVGTTAAQKLRVGIPLRPRKSELEEFISQTAKNDGESEFIRSLYEEVKPQKAGFMQVEEKTVAGNERMLLKKTATKSELDKLWDLTAQTERNNVRINAVIDIKAVPEMISRGKWEGELMPELNEEDKAKAAAAYTYEEFAGTYLLNEETDEDAQKELLNAMLRAGFQGAVRHINQLIDVKVVGVINSPDPIPNGNTAYIPLDALQGDAGMNLEGAVTELLIRIKDAKPTDLPSAKESAAAITSALEKTLGEPLPNTLAVFSWADYSKDYLSYERTEGTATQFIAYLLFFLSFLGISNTILLAVLERTKEIGMMRALGMTDGQMKLVYSFEAGFLGLIGSVFGIMIGCALNYPLVKYGWDLSSMANNLDGGLGFRVTAIMRSSWNLQIIIGSGITATLLAAFMAYLPMRRAIKMPITDSLRFE